jgi:hypothetical protein
VELRKRDIARKFQQRRPVHYLGDCQHNLPTIRQSNLQQQIHPQVHSLIVDEVGAATLVAALSICPGTALRGRVRAETDRVKSASKPASKPASTYKSGAIQQPNPYLKYRITPYMQDQK